MQRNFSTSAEFTVSREGLYQCRKSDPGNWTLGAVGHGNIVGTMRGVSAPIMVRWVGDASLVTATMMKNVDRETFEAIFSSLYWRALNADSLIDGVDLMLADFGFNAGIARAAKQFQQIIGMIGPALDGDIGAETLDAMRVAAVRPDVVAPAIARHYAQLLQRDVGVTDDGEIGPKTLTAVRAHNAGARAVIYALASRQEAAYRSFRTFQENGDGWLARLRARLDAALALEAAHAA